MPLQLFASSPEKDQEEAAISGSDHTYRDAMERMLGCAVVLHGAETLADLADLEFAVLLRDAGLQGVAERIGLEDAAAALAKDVAVGREFGEALDALDPRRRRIALARTYARDPMKLAALGAEFGVSRERARQLEAGMRHSVESRTGERLRDAALSLRRTVGAAAPEDEFHVALAGLVADAPDEYRTAAEVAVMQECGYEPVDGCLVGDREFRALASRVRSVTQACSNDAGVVDEEALRETAAGDEDVPWEMAVQSAGLVRIGDHLVARDTRRVRVYLALAELGRPAHRTELSKAAGLANNTTLSSLLSSDRLFVRATKDKWALRGWTEDPYEGVVAEIVKRIERGGGEIAVDELLDELPAKFDVLPATVRNYLATRKFATRRGKVRVVEVPAASIQDLADARDVMWTADRTPVLHFVVGEHHLKGNSQKVSVAVAQHLGIGPDDSVQIPFLDPPDVHPASLIWRSYDPNGPEMGRLREALTALDAGPGSKVYVVLHPDGLRMRTSDRGLSKGARSGTKRGRKRG